MKDKQLISIIIIAYNNAQYIFEAIDSVLRQDYSDIELLISDDGSSDFPLATVQKYIEERNRGNIKQVIINVNENNIGTVKHLNKIIPMTTGEYISFFAADDAMYDEHTVTNIMNAFASLPESEYVITSQLAMFDENLETCRSLFVTDKKKEKILSCTPEQIFFELATTVLYSSAGTCFKRQVFDQYGYFDEDYILVEDWTYAAKLASMGISYHYFDFISYKHRDGGVSHGNTNGVSQSKEMYVSDCLRLYEKLFFPNLEKLNTDQKFRMVMCYSLIMDKVPKSEYVLSENSSRAVISAMASMIRYYTRTQEALHKQLAEKNKQVIDVSAQSKQTIDKVKLFTPIDKKNILSEINADAHEMPVSVVVASYNSEATILDTLDSIYLQSYKKLEVIVTDDASSDRTKKLVQKWIQKNGSRFTNAKLIVSDKNAGTAINCNRGFKECTGEYIKLIAADDILKKNCIVDLITGILSQNGDIAFCYEYVFFPEDIPILFTDEDVKLEKRPPSISIFNLEQSEMYKALLKGNILPAPTSIIKKSLFDKLGGFDEKYPYTEDYPFWLKAIKYGAKIIFVDTVGVYYRKDINSISWRENKTPSVEQQRFQNCLDSFIKDVRNPEMQRLGIPIVNVCVRPDAQSIQLAQARTRIKTNKTQGKGKWSDRIFLLDQMLGQANMPKLLRIFFLLLSPNVFLKSGKVKSFLTMTN